MSKKIKLNLLALGVNQPNPNSYTLVLGEADGRRRFPMIVGSAEAYLIAIEIQNINTYRPMTHDLFLSLAGKFNINVKEIIISKLVDGIFYCTVVCHHHKDFEYINIDSRPSDAIAIAVRSKAPIYVYEDIIEEASIEIEDKDIQKVSSNFRKSSTARRKQTLEELGVKDLQKLLNTAIQAEDYEEAARIRDELSRRQ